jgi:hypothetical protein
MGTGWLTPVILASWEAEIGRITVRGQFGHTVGKSLSQKYPPQAEVLRRQREKAMRGTDQRLE